MRDYAELLSAYFDESLTPAEALQLRDWLKSDEQNWRTFVRASVIHSRLRDVMLQHDIRGLVFEGAFGDAIDPRHIACLLNEEEEAQRVRKAAEQAQRESQARTDELLDRKSLRIEERREPSLLVYAGVVVAASLLVMFGRLLGPVSQPSERPAGMASRSSEAPPVIAEIANSFDAELVFEDQPVVAGAELSAGLLTLESGVAEVEFSSGVKLVIEAPSHLQLLTTDRAKLLSGRLVAHVPQQALGFTLHSAAAAFVDLGTEFGVEIDQIGAASIHVLDGEVALVSEKKSASPSRTLRYGAANKVSSEGAIADIPFDGARFVRRVPRSAYELAVMKSQPLAYWRLDGAKGNVNLASEGRLSFPTFVNGGVSFVDKRDRQNLVGAPANAARFEGEHDGIDVNGDAALGVVANCTYEGWVLPMRAMGPQRIFSTFDRPRSGMAIGVVNGEWYKLSDDDLKFHFTVYGQYDCVSAKPIEPGKWVHVATTIDSNGTPTLYVNGQEAERRFRPINLAGGDLPDADSSRVMEAKDAALVEWSATRETPVGKATAGHARIGRNPQGADGDISPECWQGEISSVAIYDRVLEAQEIRRHFAATSDKLTDHSSEQPLDQSNK